MQKSAAMFITKAWQDNSSWLILLRPLSILFNIIRNIRLFYYTKLRTPLKLNTEIIVIGNISVGGTGKTSMVIKVAQLLLEARYRVAIVTRGYGKSKGILQPEIVQEVNPNKYGDEPSMLFQKLGIPIFVCDNRVKSLQIAQSNSDFIICDDGLQDYRFERSYEVAMVDGEVGFGNTKLLPEGFLREPVSRLKKCDMVVQLGYPPLLKQADMLCQYQANNIKRVIDGELISLDDALKECSNKKVHAFSGLGNNKRFFLFLEKIGFSFIEHSLQDHHIYKADDFYYDGSIQLMTSKDAIKCSNLANENFWYLDVSLDFNQKDIDRLIFDITN